MATVITVSAQEFDTGEVASLTSTYVYVDGFSSVRSNVGELNYGLQSDTFVDLTWDLAGIDPIGIMNVGSGGYYTADQTNVKTISWYWGTVTGVIASGALKTRIDVASFGGNTVLKFDNFSDIDTGEYTIKKISDLIIEISDPNVTVGEHTKILLLQFTFSGAQLDLVKDDANDRFGINMESGFTSPYPHPQIVTFSDQAPAGICFGAKSRLVVDMDGTTKAIDECGGEVMVKVVSPEGDEKLVKAQVCRTRQAKLNHGVEIVGLGDQPLIVSRKHSLFVKNDFLSTFAPAIWCSKCKAYGKSTDCRKCCGWTIAGYHKISPEMVRHSPHMKTMCFYGDWYHIILPKAYRLWGLALGNGLLSESFRHDFGSIKEDALFTLI
jgi:hypothetical protein